MKLKDMTKRMLAGFFSLILVLNITGCGSSSEKATTPEGAEEVPPEVQEAVDQAIQDAEAAEAAAAENQQ